MKDIMREIRLEVVPVVIDHLSAHIRKDLIDWDLFE
jgi:hypothetical protein